MTENDYSYINGSNTIMIVEDEEDISRLLAINLELEGFTPVCIKSGDQAYSRLKEVKPLLILLDLMIPGIDGITLCKKIRGNKDIEQVPIIMLTAKSDEADIVKGLVTGADDYMTKPFSAAVLIARVHAVLRRFYGPPKTDQRLNIGTLSIDAKRYQAWVSEEKLDLTLSEFHILKLLVSKPGWVFSRSQIIDAIRGDNYAVTERSIDFQIVGLRKKLKSVSDNVETVRGIGYRFREPATE